MNGAKEKIQIIIVEDDNKQQEMYKDCIEEFNIDNPNYEIEAFQLANDQDVPKLIYNNHIDAIIVDLDWGTGLQQNEGNRLVKKIYKDCRVPIFIVSGNLQLLDEEYTESPILKKYQRDDVDFNILLKEIEELYITGYTKVMGNQSKIDEMLSKVFWKHMSNVIEHWKEQEPDGIHILRQHTLTEIHVAQISFQCKKLRIGRDNIHTAVGFYNITIGIRQRLILNQLANKG